MGHSVNGRNLCGIIGGYMVIKGVVNLILSFGFTNILMLAVSAGLAFGLIIGFKFMNFVTAGFLAAMVVAHIADNIRNIGFNAHLLYLAEAVIDVVCAYKLLTNIDIKEHFGQN